MGRVYKRGNSWYLDLYVKGRRVRKKVGTSKRIAELALKDAEVKAAKDEYGFTKTDISIDKFVTLFLDYSRANHQPRTTARYKAVMDHFQQFLEDHKNILFISQVTAETIEKYKVYRKDADVNPNGSSDISEHTRKGARAHTINFEIGALKTIFNLAIKWGYIKTNPTSEVNQLKVNDSKPNRFLTKKEIQLLLDHSPPHLYPIFFTFLHTGMRKAELENLEWTDIDLRRKKIRIRRKESWQPKTGERDIPISDPLHQLLSERKKQSESTYVFPHHDNSRIKIKLREQLIKIAQQANIPDLTKLHTLRHTFASHLVMNGVDLPTVKDLMGHSDIQTTMTYAHLAPDHLKDSVNKLKY